jgi:uncharacterized protein (UPF0548 family)
VLDALSVHAENRQLTAWYLTTYVVSPCRLLREQALFLLRRPNEAFIQETIESQREKQLTYPGVGLTRESGCPAGFRENQWRAVIGAGEEVFLRAKDALANWRMLDLGWVEVVSTPDSLVENALVGTLARTLGTYSLNVARIVYVDDEDAGTRFGFGYGTLPEYPLSGEERFTVTYDPTTQDVVYEIFSFSRPTSLMVRLGQPFVRRAQRRFCCDSVAAMEAACRL